MQKAETWKIIYNLAAEVTETTLVRRKKLISLTTGKITFQTLKNVHNQNCPG